MSIKEKYGITFNSRFIDGKKYSFCDVSDPNYYNLSFFDHFRSKETSDFIDDLNSCITHNFNISDIYRSDSLENLYKIEYKHPNMVIDDGIVIISMLDLKELLQDWLAFITQ